MPSQLTVTYDGSSRDVLYAVIKGAIQRNAFALDSSNNATNLQTTITPSQGKLTDGSAIQAVTIPGGTIVVFFSDNDGRPYFFIDTSQGSAATVDATVLSPSTLPSVTFTGTFAATVSQTGVLLIGCAEDSNKDDCIQSLYLPFDFFANPGNAPDMTTIQTCQWGLTGVYSTLDPPFGIDDGHAYLAATCCNVPTADANDAADLESYVVAVLEVRRHGHSACGMLGFVCDLGSLSVPAAWTMLTTAPMPCDTDAYPIVFETYDGAVNYAYMSTGHTQVVQGGLQMSSLGDGSANVMPWSYAEAVALLTMYDDSSPFAFCYGYGTATQTTSSQNSNLTDMTVPLYFTLFSVQGNQIVVATLYTTEAMGYLQRTGMPECAQALYPLIGIVEGAPPIPVENLNIPSTLDPLQWQMQPGGSQIAITKQSTETDSAMGQITAGVMVALSAYGGWKGTVGIASAEVRITYTQKLSAQYRHAWNSSTSGTFSSQLPVMSKCYQDPTTGLYALSSLGALIVLDSNWAGYAYTVLDKNKSPVGTPTLQFIAVEPHFKAFSYAINPAAGPTQGKLNTYVISDDTKKQWLNESMYSFGSNNSVPVSWNGQMTPLTSATVTESSSQTNSFTISLEASLQVMAKAFGDAIAEAGGSNTITGSLSGDASFTSGDSESMAFAPQVTLRFNAGASNVCQDYDFAAYILSKNSDFATQLQQSLITDEFPTDPNLKAMNQEALSAIDFGSSKPWKICYSVEANYTYTPQGTATGV